MKRHARALLVLLALGLMMPVQAQAAAVRPLTGISYIDDTIHVIAVTCGVGSLTAAKIIDSLIFGFAPEWAKAGETKQTTAFGQMVQQLQKQDELENYGYKGPVRRFMDKYCIIGILTGSGSCAN